jgi:hypothetical protein
MSDYNSIPDGEMRALLKKYMMEQDNEITQKLIDMEAKIAFGLTPVAALAIPGEKEMLAKLGKGALGKTSLLTWIVGMSLTAATGLGIYALNSKSASTNSENTTAPAKEKNTVTNDEKPLVASNINPPLREITVYTNTDSLEKDGETAIAEDKTGPGKPNDFFKPTKKSIFEANANVYYEANNKPFYDDFGALYMKGEGQVMCMSGEKNSLQPDSIPAAKDEIKDKRKRTKKDKTAPPVPPVPPAPPGPPAPPAPPTPPADVVKDKKNKHKDGLTKVESHMVSDSMFAGIKKIEIDAAICDLKIMRGGDENTKVKTDILIESDGKVKNCPQYRMICEKKGDVLNVKIDNAEAGQLHVDGMLNIDGKLVLEIPSKMNLDIINQSGNVEINGIDGETCKINTTYGDINLVELGHKINLVSQSGDISLVSCKNEATINSNYGDISVTNHLGALRIESTSGDISVENLPGTNGKRCSLKSNYGSVNLKSIKVPIDVKIQSGDINVEDCEGNLEIISGYGQQDIKNIKGNLNVVSTSGDVHVNGLTGNIHIQSSYGNVITNDCVGDININAVSGDIKGKNIKVNTALDLNATYGDIKMQLANGMDDLSFDLLANMGDIKVRKAGQVIVGEEGKLQIQKGKINIKALTTSGSQLFE